MTSAEYKTIREACGLSQQAAADFHQVALRTVQYWESGRSNVPAGVANELHKLNARLENAVSEAVDLYTRQGASANMVTLARYHTAAAYADSRAARDGLPYPCHNALMGRTMQALERLGAHVTIDWAPSPL